MPAKLLTAPACAPERECANASTRQLVSRSGTFTGTEAEPDASVTTSGSKRNVSGNQARPGVAGASAGGAGGGGGGGAPGASAFIA